MSILLAGEPGDRCTATRLDLNIDPLFWTLSSWNCQLGDVGRGGCTSTDGGIDLSQMLREKGEVQRHLTANGTA